jgi:hypothetical protein
LVDLLSEKSLADSVIKKLVVISVISVFTDSRLMFRLMLAGGARGTTGQQLGPPLGSLYHSRFLLRFANIAGSIETPRGDAETEKDFNFTTGHEFS